MSDTTYHVVVFTFLTIIAVVEGTVLWRDIKAARKSRRDRDKV